MRLRRSGKKVSKTFREKREKMIKKYLSLISYRQFLPKKEEIEDKEIQLLAKKLKGKNDAETLTNILEWEDRNLTFWYERWLVYIILLVITSFSVLVLLLFLEANTLIVAIVGATFLMTVFGGKLLEFLVPLLFSYCVSLAIVVGIALFSKGLVISFHLLMFFIAASLLVGAFLSIISYLVSRYRSIKRDIPEFKISDTFLLSLPVGKILKYRLSVCRDYAKLTMALLLNLYPNAPLYFVEMPNHVAAAIKLNEDIYVLDQKLPILKLDKWVLYWSDRLKKRKLRWQLLRVSKNAAGNVKVEKVKYDLQSKTRYSSKVDLAGIINDLKRELFIVKKGVKSSEEFKIVILKKFKVLCEDDEVVKLSIKRLVKRKIDDEFCGRTQDIVDLDLQLENEDLVLKVRLGGRGK